ncbi:hypothetical protein F544_20580 [Bibersteinia trehalosi USDA-ARS-USMARC-190]|uniref:Uncharacterized protein n=1 Tax=Bibersteinia trehalosi USDA-ARS-USMARC-190 TaxID=1263832 RepID=W0R931_BIBTR|nr:hypothetical protein F544_20580 [Bibersteinia trehalosi USDA-ARS-USMARC-190]
MLAKSVLVIGYPVKKIIIDYKFCCGFCKRLDLGIFLQIFAIIRALVFN